VSLAESSTVNGKYEDSSRGSSTEVSREGQLKTPAEKSPERFK
jgi:hypothetical protein